MASAQDQEGQQEAEEQGAQARGPGHGEEGTDAAQREGGDQRQGVGGARQHRLDPLGRRRQRRIHDPLAQRGGGQREQALAGQPEADEQGEQEQHAGPAGGLELGEHPLLGGEEIFGYRRHGGGEQLQPLPQCGEARLEVGRGLVLDRGRRHRGGRCRVRRGLELPGDPALHHRVGQELQQRLDLLGRRLGPGLCPGAAQGQHDEEERHEAGEQELTHARGIQGQDRGRGSSAESPRCRGRAGAAARRAHRRRHGAAGPARSSAPGARLGSASSQRGVIARRVPPVRRPRPVITSTQRLPRAWDVARNAASRAWASAWVRPCRSRRASIG